MESFGQVFAAFPAWQHMLQTQHKILVFGLVFLRGRDGIVETHGVEIMPECRTPDRGEHTIVAVIISGIIDGNSGADFTSFPVHLK